MAPGSEAPIDLAAAHVVIAGLGVTGRAVHEVLADRVRRLTTIDRHPEADLHDPADVDLAAVDLVIASPGWPPHSSLFVAAAERGIPIWSEVELAWRLRTPISETGEPAPWLAVTGTNGKTTTVEMLASILTAGGRRTRAVGNVGRPLIVAALDPQLDVLAIELSSYQLHFTSSMSPWASAVLNVAPDHLDWHGSFEAYARAKGRIFANTQVACVYPVGDLQIKELVRAADVGIGARAVGFTDGAPGRGELGVVEHVLVDRAFHAAADDPTRHEHAAELATLADLGHLTGPDGAVAIHSIRNALAAAALARSVGVSAEAVAAGLRAFRGGRHRIEFVATIDDVQYIDDSKATNAHAALASLRSFPAGSVVWIAGGLAKGATFDDLVVSAADRLHAVVLIGVDNHELAEALSRHAPKIPVVHVDPGDTGSVMSRAVDTARALAGAGSAVLLAPAGASMDQFRSYAERGDAFVTAVRNLADAPVTDAS